MADAPQDPHLLALLKSMAPYAPGAAGAMMSMAFGEGLTARGKFLSLMIGGCSVLWFAPAVVVILSLFWGGPLPLPLVGFVGFLSGLCGMGLFAGIAQAVAKYAKDPLKLVKFRAGGFSVGEGGE